MAHFPITAPAFDGRSRTVGAGAALDWLRLGWGMFMVNPGLWIAASVIVIVSFLALFAVWLAGPLLACLLAPVLAAGLLTMCRKASTVGRFDLQDIGSGFRTATTPLVILGLIFMAATAIIKLIVFALFSGSVAGGLLMPGVTGLGLLLGGSLLAMLFSSVLIIPLAMALWFAPALVMFNNMPPFDACKASLNACLKNIMPFLILGLVFFVLSFFAALPVGLGFLVLLPVLSGTAYASYQDVFVAH
jgi:uncharacterized membrane protein